MVFNALGATPYDGTSLRVVHSEIGELQGVKNISFGQGLERTKVKGVGNQDIGYTPGRFIAQDATMTVWVSELNDIILKSGGDRLFWKRSFDLTLTLSNEFGVPLKTIVLINCMPKAISQTFNTDDTGLLVADITLDVLRVFEGGPGSAALETAFEIIRQVI